MTDAELRAEAKAWAAREWPLEGVSSEQAKTYLRDFQAHGICGYLAGYLAGYRARAFGNEDERGGGA